MDWSNLQNILAKELERQQNSLELIASENYVSKEVLWAYANIFTNKYSEWYPGKRYYGGNQYVDELEIYTQQLALQIFDLDPFVRWVNVQPLSWSTANLAVYTWLLNPWDTILAMDLATWWHLTHGMKLNASGKYFNFVHYGVDKDGYIDKEQLLKLALDHKPKMIIAWFSSYPRELERDIFVEAKNLLKQDHDHDTLLMADISHIAGLIAGWVHESVFETDFDIVTTTTHKTLRWPRGALIYFRLPYQKQIERGVFPGVQGWPFDHVLYAKAVALEEILGPWRDKDKRKNYTHQIILNNKTFAKWLIDRWRQLATGGTDNHLIVMDVSRKWLDWNLQDTWLTGKEAELLLEEIGLSVNKQLIPYDNRSPQDPSGIRLGTPAVTTRWLIEEDIDILVDVVDRVLSGNKEWCAEAIWRLCDKYPLWY